MQYLGGGGVVTGSWKREFGQKTIRKRELKLKIQREGELKLKCRGMREGAFKL